MPPYPLDEWNAEQLRLTIFPVAGAVNPNPEQWWEQVLGEPPEESTANPRLGLRTLVGAYNAGKLLLKMEPERIDWIWIPQEPQETPDEMPSIGPITEALPLFSRIAEHWLGRDDIPDIARIAFGSVLRHPEQDRRSAYIRLPDYLPLQINPDSSDFSFQINVPVASRTGIDGLQINRLSKWSVMVFASVKVRLEGTALNALPLRFTSHALRVEVDINTSPEFRGPIPRARLADVYHEMIEWAQQIVREGLRDGAAAR